MRAAHGCVQTGVATGGARAAHLCGHGRRRTQATQRGAALHLAVDDGALERVLALELDDARARFLTGADHKGLARKEVVGSRRRRGYKGETRVGEGVRTRGPRAWRRPEGRAARQLRTLAVYVTGPVGPAALTVQTLVLLLKRALVT